MIHTGRGDGNLTAPAPGITSLEDRFARAQHKLNSSRRDLVRQIMENPEETYFLSSRELAKRFQVDAATVVRTVQALGYEKYGDFAAALRSHFVSQISPYAVMKVATRDRRSISGHIDDCLQMSARNLAKLRSELSVQTVVEAARQIKRSRRVMVVGVDFAAPLASLLAYALTAIGFNAEAPIGTTGNLHQKVNLLRSSDLLIAITFGRGLKATVEALLQARALGAHTIGITDSTSSALARSCHLPLIASVASPSWHGTYVAPLALIDTLLVACAHIQPKRSLVSLKEKEKEFKSGERWYSPPEDTHSASKEHEHVRTTRK